MATLTLKKSVNKDMVVSKKGDSVFVERKRTILMPGQSLLTDAPKNPNARSSAQDEKLRAVLAAAKAREDERRAKQQDEADQIAERERQITADQESYAAVKEKLNARNAAASEPEEAPAAFERKFGIPNAPRKSIETEAEKAGKNKRAKSFGKGKISVRDIIMDENDTDLREEKRRSEASIRRFREKARAMFKPAQKVDREVILGDSIIVKDLALAMAEKVGNVIKKLMEMGMMASQNQTIDADTAELIANEFGAKVRRVVDKPYAELLDREPNPKNLKPRAPVITVVGHVDHGKTSLLDAFRDTKVADGEAGGITQHIAAYEVKTKSGRMITFLDTPGHETFSAMRARGAQMADIVVLVVAANDSVKPQTIEAINHIKAAKVPFIVAINKIDLPDANAQKVRTDLLQHEIQVESMGGEIQAIEISATKRINLDKLEDAILLQADMMGLTADPDMPAVAQVVEAKMEHGLGPTATILMKQGTLSVGDAFVVGETWGRVRGLISSAGVRVEKIGPAEPAVLLGIESVPLAGDELRGLETDQQAREVAEWRTDKARAAASVVKKSSLEELFAHKNETKKMALPVVLRADVQGSVEAITDMLNKIESEKAEINILSAGVGAITEGDVRLAAASKGIIVAFNVRANGDVRDLARELSVDIRYHSIVYRITDELKEILAGKLAPERRENFIGYADVIALFVVGKGVKVAGCRVTEGTIRRDANVRLLRDNVVIYDGKIGVMKHEKNDIKEATKGMEFGMSFDKYNDLEISDRVECYEIENIKATL
ncbi:MAG: translation initiation factor IF-2 [Rickettsiales bacterium]|jgi:translation initiation factor IF-2|nr:translation initiation factor IF-2 [Rickettsiales bacterium]